LCFFQNSTICIFINVKVKEGKVPMMKVLEKIGFKQDDLYESAQIKK